MAFDQPETEVGLVRLRADQSLAGLVPVSGKLGTTGGAPPRRAGRNVDHFCSCVELFAAEAITRQLAAHGVAHGPVSQRFGAEGDGPSIDLGDLEGNGVALKGLPDSP